MLNPQPRILCGGVAAAVVVHGPELRGLDVAEGIVRSTRPHLASGQVSPVFLHPQDARFHTYIIGKTGSGKAALLKNLIAQQIQKGSGVALNDPHGDLSQALFEFIPGQESTPGLGGVEDFEMRA